MVTKTWLGVYTNTIESTGCCAYLCGLGVSFHESSPNVFVKGSKRRDAHRKGASLCSLAGINSHFLSVNSIGSSVWVGALAVEQSCPTLWGQKASKRPRVQPEQLNDRPLTLRALPVLTMEFTSCVRYKALVSTSKSIHFDLATKSRKKLSSFILSFLTYFTHNEYTVRLGRKIDS